VPEKFHWGRNMAPRLVRIRATEPVVPKLTWTTKQK
jgi:hypothetical protein